GLPQPALGPALHAGAPGQPPRVDRGADLGATAAKGMTTSPSPRSPLPRPLSPRERGDLIRALAAEVGFDEVGFAPAAPLDPEPFERVLREGLSADMDWLRDERRLDPAKVLEGARTVAVFVKGYFDPAQPPGWIARSARG